MLLETVVSPGCDIPNITKSTSTVMTKATIKVTMKKACWERIVLVRRLGPTRLEKVTRVMTRRNVE